MVYGIAQRHNAEIDISSEPGKGTTMRLLFPAAPPSNAAVKDRDSNPALTRLRVLAVDDDPLLIKSLRDALETDGHLVTTANGGQEGIDIFEQSVASGDRFAAVITDLGMPYVDGRKVSAAVKAASPRTPVVLLTGWGQRLTEQGDVPPHVDRVLNKPPKLRELRVALRELVAGSDLAALAKELPAASAPARQSSGLLER
jgi:CheY-like chemotaxis protein